MNTISFDFNDRFDSRESRSIFFVTSRLFTDRPCIIDKLNAVRDFWLRFYTVWIVWWVFLDLKRNVLLWEFPIGIRGVLMRLLVFFLNFERFFFILWEFWEKNFMEWSSSDKKVSRWNYANRSLSEFKRHFYAKSVVMRRKVFWKFWNASQKNIAKSNCFLHLTRVFFTLNTF